MAWAWMQVENHGAATLSLNHNWINRFNLQAVLNTLLEDGACAARAIEDCRAAMTPEEFAMACQRMIRTNSSFDLLDFYAMVTLGAWSAFRCCCTTGVQEPGLGPASLLLDWRVTLERHHPVTTYVCHDLPFASASAAWEWAQRDLLACEAAALQLAQIWPIAATPQAMAAAPNTQPTQGFQTEPREAAPPVFALRLRATCAPDDTAAFRATRVHLAAFLSDLRVILSAASRYSAE
jgi:hypothetical protein